MYCGFWEKGGGRGEHLDVSLFCRLALLQRSLTRFRADELFIVMWPHCHDNRAGGQGAGSYFWAVCNVTLGKLDYPLKLVQLEITDQRCSPFTLPHSIVSAALLLQEPIGSVCDMRVC